VSCGLVALGDSITYGHGGMQSGLGSQSWAQWLAEGLGLPFTRLAVNGATAADVVGEQLPRLGGRYEVGCLYVGVNDVRRVEFDPDAYARDVEAVAGALAERCSRRVILTIPLALGLPPALPEAIAHANEAVEAAAARHGAAVADLRDFAGRRWVWADRVHATAAGQVEIADRAARALGAPLPSRTVVAAPRPDAAYAVHYAKRAIREHVRAAFVRAHLGVTGRLPVTGRADGPPPPSPRAAARRARR
jgi:lysophospholipase L1-like esterase